MMASIAANIEQLEKAISGEIASAGDEAALEAVRVSALGKKGAVSELLRGLGGMSPEDRQVNGPLINGLKTRVTDEINARRELLKAQALEARLATETVDVTLPVREPAVDGAAQCFADVDILAADLNCHCFFDPELPINRRRAWG